MLLRATEGSNIYFWWKLVSSNGGKSRVSKRCKPVLYNVEHFYILENILHISGNKVTLPQYIYNFQHKCTFQKTF